MNGHEHFDARLRAAHAVALERLSPSTQAQLAQRQRRALAARHSAFSTPLLRWSVATLAVAVVAVGLFHPGRGPSPAPPDVASSVAAAPSAETIDDNPDFYLWLASSDATSLASE